LSREEMVKNKVVTNTKIEMVVMEETKTSPSEDVEKSSPTKVKVKSASKRAIGTECYSDNS